MLMQYVANGTTLADYRLALFKCCTAAVLRVHDDERDYVCISAGESQMVIIVG